MKLPTASRIERAIKCEASTVLPIVEREGGQHQEQGREMHRFLEAVRNSGRDAALDTVAADYHDLCEAIPLDLLPVKPEAFAAEVAFAFDAATGKARELGRGLGRRYDVSQSEFAGTADVVALMQEDAIYIGDWKPRWSPNVTPARENWQLRALAVMASRAYGRSRAMVDLIHVGADGAWFDRAELDAFDLDTAAAELQVLAHRIAVLAAEPLQAQPTEGPWCRFCPSFAYCPAKARLASSLALAAQNGETWITLTRENAGLAWERMKAARQVLDRIEETLADYAREAPFQTPSGATVMPQEKRVETLDPDAAPAILERLGLGEAVERKVTKTALTRYAGKARAEEALAELRKAGAVKVSVTHPVGEVRKR